MAQYGVPAAQAGELESLNILMNAERDNERRKTHTEMIDEHKLGNDKINFSRATESI